MPLYPIESALFAQADVTLKFGRIPALSHSQCWWDKDVSIGQFPKFLS